MNEMFLNNTPRDDVAMLVNLLSQIRDLGGEFPEATVYDPLAKCDYGISDVLGYVRRKYGENFC